MGGKFLGISIAGAGLVFGAVFFFMDGMRPQYHKFAAHKPLYGSVIATLAIFYMGLAGQDTRIFRNVANGTYDLNAMHELYLNITDRQTLNLVWNLAVFGIFAGIAYAVITHIAHSKIARDSIGYRPF